MGAYSRLGAYSNKYGDCVHFRVSPGLCIKTRLSAQPLVRKLFFHSHANKTHFHVKRFALGLILKVRGFGTRKKPTKLVILKIIAERG